jgi:hypothetical protein
VSLGTLPHIAFIGRAGAGKTTAAELLVKHFGYDRLSFAAPLKVACGTTTDRSLLQNVGTGVRELCPDFWVNLFIHDLYDGDRAIPIVVDDCRFPNEAHRLGIEGFTVIRVAAASGDRILRLRANGKLQDEAQLEHVSETALDDYTAADTIYNTSSPEHLLHQLTAILNREQR